MSVVLTLSDEELAELERLLTAIADRTLIEIRRTDNQRFRQEIERRYRLDEDLLDRIRQAQREAPVS